MKREHLTILAICTLSVIAILAITQATYDKDSEREDVDVNDRYIWSLPFRYSTDYRWVLANEFDLDITEMFASVTP